MNKIKLQAAALALAAGWLATGLAAHAQNMNLQKVLSAMDASSAKFKDVQANITVDLYTAVVQAHEIQTGTTALRRVGKGLEMAIHLKTDDGQPAEKYVLYKNGNLYYYQPAVKQETIFAAGANRSQWDAMLATGFGATSQELNAAWTVTFQGMEKIDGIDTAKLDLVPKQANVRDNYVSHLTIWVDLNRDISLKQVMYMPSSGDSKTMTYSGIRYNTRLPGSLFELHVARGTHVQKR